MNNQKGMLKMIMMFMFLSLLSTIIPNNDLYACLLNTESDFGNETGNETLCKTTQEALWSGYTSDQIIRDKMFNKNSSIDDSNVTSHGWGSDPRKDISTG